MISGVIARKISPIHVCLYKTEAEENQHSGTRRARLAVDLGGTVVHKKKK